MKIINCAVVLLICSTSFLTKALELTPGIWQGQVAMHNKDPQNALFKVKRNDGDFTIVMYFNDRPYTFENLSIVEDKIQFNLDTGLDYDCSIEEDKKNNLVGECLVSNNDEELRRIKIKLQPPKIDSIETEPEMPEESVEGGQTQKQ